MPVPSLVNWTKITNGFDFSNDKSISKLCVYNNKIYAGNESSLGLYRCRIYESTDGLSFSVSKEFIDHLGAIGGDGGIIGGMCVHDDGLHGPCLYAIRGWYSGSNIECPTVHRFDGSIWNDISGNFLGSATGNPYAITKLISYNNKLYVSATTADGNACIWSSSIGSGVWTREFTLADTGAGVDVCEFNGDIFVLTHGVVSGFSAKIFKMSGGIWDTGTILPSGFQFGSSLQTFNDELYALTYINSTKARLNKFDGISWSYVNELFRPYAQVPDMFVTANNLLHIGANDGVLDMCHWVSSDGSDFLNTQTYTPKTAPRAQPRSDVGFFKKRTYFGSQGSAIYRSDELVRADFSGTPTVGMAPLIVSFTDSSIGNPSSWFWNFGDGNTSTLQNPIHTYSEPGSYTVSLIIKGGEDDYVQSNYVVVGSAPPPLGAAEFTAIPTSGTMPLTVSFTDLSFSVPVSWFWDFGDGNVSTLQNPIHTYNSSGLYSVTLIINIDLPNEDMKTKSKYVNIISTSVNASTTIATPSGSTYLENAIVTLSSFKDSTMGVPDLTARIYWQRYAQSESSVFDIVQRSNIAGSTGCLSVRYFDPDGIPTPLYRGPTECMSIAVPIEKTVTDIELQEIYNNGDFSIQIEGKDAVYDMGFKLKSLFDSTGGAIPFTDFQPGNIYIHPELGMFMFFHFPDSWDACSYWEFAWWDNGALSESQLSEYPYVSLWDDESSGFGSGGSNPDDWDNEDWDNIDNPIPLNTYWDTVSEAPVTGAIIAVSYWTKDNTDPLEPRPEVIARDSVLPDADIAWHYRSELFTSPITMSTDTQLRFRSVNDLGAIEDTKVESYIVGLRFDLQRGVNLISQPNEVPNPAEASLDNAFSGLDVLQIFRLDSGYWQVYVPSVDSDNVYDSINNPTAFNAIDNKHGLFVVMTGPGTFCFPYGQAPEITELTLVNKENNQGINAIGVPRHSLQDNSIDNVLLNRGIEFDEISRVTNGMFETYITGRASVLNFSPAELRPGRGYGVVTSRAQTFELPFID